MTLGTIVAQSTTPALRVVVANDVVADLVRAVADHDVDIIQIGRSGGDPHHFEPTPADAKQVESADLVIQFGLGLDRGLGEMHKSTGSKATVLVVADGLADAGAVDASHASDTHDDHDHDHKHEHAHATAGVDPHIWHDPTKVRVLIERICAALSAARPDLAEKFRARSREYDSQLVKLDEWIKSQVERIPQSKRVLVTTHDGLRWFGTRFGFRVVAIEMMSGSVEGADPSPAQIMKLVMAVRESGSSAVFGDAAHPSRSAATVAREAKVRLIESLRLDSLLQPPAGKEGKAYLETMRSNVTAIVEALQE